MIIYVNIKIDNYLTAIAEIFSMKFVNRRSVAHSSSAAGCIAPLSSEPNAPPPNTRAVSEMRRVENDISNRAAVADDRAFFNTFHSGSYYNDFISL